MPSQLPHMIIDQAPTNLRELRSNRHGRIRSPFCSVYDRIAPYTDTDIYDHNTITCNTAKYCPFTSVYGLRICRPGPYKAGYVFACYVFLLTISATINSQHFMWIINFICFLAILVMVVDYFHLFL